MCTSLRKSRIDATLALRSPPTSRSPFITSRALRRLDSFGAHAGFSEELAQLAKALQRPITNPVRADSGAHFPRTQIRIRGRWL